MPIRRAMHARRYLSIGKSEWTRMADDAKPSADGEQTDSDGEQVPSVRITHMHLRVRPSVLPAHLLNELQSAVHDSRILGRTRMG